MNPRVLLVGAPLALVVLLAQSVAWVPGYDDQSRGGSARLERFIEASIGDAKLLNPILNADTSSSRITDLVFDGLLDLDENLTLRGRLASRWTVSETADLVVDEGASFPDGTPVTTARMLERLRARAVADPELGDLLESLEVLPAEERTERIDLAREDPPSTARVAVALPPRIRLRLRRVDQSLLERLEPVLGPGYTAGFDPLARMTVSPESARDAVAPRLGSLLPVLSHRPEIVFELRDGVTFHDGHPFDAGDVAFTYRAIIEPRNLSPRASDFEPIERVEVIDPRTVRVVYKRLFSPAISAWTIGILPEHLLAESAPSGVAGPGASDDDPKPGMRDLAFNRAPVGTGPFRFEEWRSDELIHLSRNDRYWDGPPRYRDFFFRIIPDLVTQEAEFRAGAIDTYPARPHQAARYREDPRYRAFSATGRGYTYIGYNLRRAKFADPRVRRALGLAIDTGAIIRYVLYDEGDPISGPYPLGTPWYDESVPNLGHDPAAAARLLAQAGYVRNAEGWLAKDGEVLELALISNNGNPLRKAVLAIAQDAWRKLGVRAHTQVFEWAVFLEDFVNTGDFDAVVLGWSMGVDFDLFQLWHSSQTGRHQLNFVGYENAEADDLIERLRREYDQDEQRRLAHRLHRRIAEDQPYTFLFAPRGTRVLDRKIVMSGPDGADQPVRAAASGDLFFHFNRWHKLAHAPEL